MRLGSSGGGGGLRNSTTPSQAKPATQATTPARFTLTERRGIGRPRWAVAPPAPGVGGSSETLPARDDYRCPRGPLQRCTTGLGKVRSPIASLLGHPRERSEGG